MKKIFTLLLWACLGQWLHADAQLLERLKDKVKQKAEQRIDNKADKTIDKALDKVDPAKTKNASAKESGTNTEVGAQPAGNNRVPALKSYSKYDFVPGNKILYSADFSNDAIGELPVNWNTNGNAALATLEKIPGKWLKLEKDTKVVTGFRNKLPENLTIEFDLLANFEPSKGIPPYIKFSVFENAGAGGNAELGNYPPGVDVEFRLNYNPPDDEVVVSGRDANKGRFFDGPGIKTGVFNNANAQGQPVHVALYRQKQRLRIWLNEQKICDMPRVISDNINLNRMGVEIWGQSSVTGSNYFLSNLKVAEAEPDDRGKLIGEGRWSTSGILFDVNSDQIKPVSYGVLREVAKVLAENPAIRVKIVGHTDADGNSARNLELSKARAAAVKWSLARDFGIDASRLETDGMGDAKPVADNKTPEGKAQNRRVEFIKL